MIIWLLIKNTERKNNYRSIRRINRLIVLKFQLGHDIMPSTSEGGEAELDGVAACGHLHRTKQHIGAQHRGWLAVNGGNPPRMPDVIEHQITGAV